MKNGTTREERIELLARFKKLHKDEKPNLEKAERIVVTEEDFLDGKVQFIDANRDITDKHILTMITSVLWNGITRDVVLVKIEDIYLVIDGQHLFAGLLALGAEIDCRVMKCDKASHVQLMRDLNNTSRAWILLQYIKAEAASGNQQYEKLLALHKKNEDFLQITALMMAYTQKTRSAATKLVKGGNFIIESKKRGDEIVGYIKEYTQKEFLPNNRAVNELVIKLILATENYSHTKMLRNLKTAKNAGIGATEKEIYNQLVKIYNK